MDFHNFASSETSALLERLQSRHSAVSLQQLHALREAVDAATRVLETPSQTHEEAHELAGRLTGALEAEIRRVREEAQAAVDAARQEGAALATEGDKLRATVVQTEAEIALLRSELETAQERVAATERDLNLTIEAHAAVEESLKKAEDALKKMEGECHQITQAKTSVEAQLHDARAAIDLMLVETEELRAQTERDATEKAAIQAELAHSRETGDSALAASNTRVQTLEQELASARGTCEQRDAALAASNTRVHTLEKDLVSARETREQRDALAIELERSTERVLALEGELAAAGDVRQNRDTIAVDLQLRIERIQSLETTVSQQEEHIRQLHASLDQSAKIESKLRGELASRPKQNAQPDSDEGEALRADVERMVSLFDASARAVTEMAAVNSSKELLTELVKRLSLQFSRVALFRLKGNRLEGEDQVGFDDATDMSKLLVPTNVDSMLTRAVTSGTIQSMTGEDVAVRSGTPFGGTPTSAVALPIVLQGTTLGVVYADDSDMPDSARGPAVHESSVGFARLLVGQVVVLLVRHTHELKTLAELSQYATTLLQEAKEMYLADSQSGKNPELLRSRLKDNIDCASQLYAYRAAMEGTAAAALLDEQIATEMEGNTQFARDLATVVRQMRSANVELTAEAS